MQFLKEKLLNFLVKALAINSRLIRRFYKVQLEIPFISKNLSDDIFASFKKDDGVEINLYKNYRWNLKKGWKYYQSLNLMDELNKRFVLEKSSLNFLRTSVNEHTLTRSLDEINEFFEKKVKNNFQKHLLVDQKNYYLKPSKDEIHLRIKHFQKRYKYIFDQLSKLDISIPTNSNCLEIGYETGGHSIFALERFGFSVHGLDNGYSGLHNVSFMPQYIKKQINSEANFHFGDITKNTEFNNGNFSLINSVAVLEHLNDMDGALKEMNRLIIPGGLMIHSYDPYFHPSGGHAIGILDSPWGHLRVNEQEYDRYLKEFRPYEYQDSLDWYLNGIHRSFPVSDMIRAIHQNNFELIYWQSNNISTAHEAYLGNSIISDAIKNYNNLSLHDFITNQHTFVARKLI